MRKKSIAGILYGLIIALAMSVNPIVASAGVFAGSFSTSLIISNTSVLVLQADSVLVSWDTSDNSSSQVFYDTASHGDIAAYVLHSVVDSTPIMHHLVTLKGLQDSTVYHFRTVSTANVSGVLFSATSADLTFQTINAATPPEQVTTGGSVDLVGFGGSSSLTLNASGVTLASARLTTVDGQISLLIPAGTQILDSNGQPLGSLSVSPHEGVLPQSTDTIISAWDFGPAGATFNPPITLTLAYSSEALAAAGGVVETSLNIAFWDGSGWQRLTSTVDTRAKTVSASCLHFTLFAIIGEKSTAISIPVITPSTPAPPPIPSSQPPVQTVPPETPALPTPSIPLTPPQPEGTSATQLLKLWPIAAVALIEFIAILLVLRIGTGGLKRRLKPAHRLP